MHSGLYGSSPRFVALLGVVPIMPSYLYSRFGGGREFGRGREGGGGCSGAFLLLGT